MRLLVAMNLRKNVADALTGRSACLLANHGMVAVGDSIISAYKLAQEVEALAKRYCISLQFGNPVLLDDKEMVTISEKFHRYGKQDINE